METTKEQALELISSILSNKQVCNIHYKDGYNVTLCLKLIEDAFKALDGFEEAQEEAQEEAKPGKK